MFLKRFCLYVVNTIIGMILSFVATTSLAQGVDILSGKMSDMTSTIASGGEAFPKLSNIELEEFDTHLDSILLGAIHVTRTLADGKVSSFTRERAMLTLLPDDRNNLRALSLYTEGSLLVKTSFDLLEARFDQASQAFYLTNAEGVFVLNFRNGLTHLVGSLLLDGNRYDFTGDMQAQVLSSIAIPVTGLSVAKVGAEFPTLTPTDVKRFDKESTDDFVGFLRKKTTLKDGQISRIAANYVSVSLFTASPPSVKVIVISDIYYQQHATGKFNISDATYDKATDTFYFNNSQGYLSISFMSDEIYVTGNLFAGRVRTELSGYFTRAR